MKVKSREWICGQCKKTYATEKEAFSCWLNHGIKKRRDKKMKNDELLKANSKNEDYPK